MSQYLNNRSGGRARRHFAAQVMRSASDWIKQYGRKKPWLLWVESFDPTSLGPPAEYAEMYCPNYQGREPSGARVLSGIAKGASLNERRATTPGNARTLIAGLDTSWKRWRRRNCATILSCFHIDHGCMMGEQDEIHKGDERMRIQVTRCPLIIRHPDRASQARPCPDLPSNRISCRHCFPWRIYRSGAVQRRGFLPMVTGERPEGLRDTVISAFGRYASVRTRDWNYRMPGRNVRRSASACGAL